MLHLNRHISSSSRLDRNNRMVNKILAQVWIPNFSNRLVLSPVERKVQVVGMAKLMCESQEVSERGGREKVQAGGSSGERMEGLMKINEILGELKDMRERERTLSDGATRKVVTS